MSRRGSSRRGVYVIAVIFVAGLIFLGGLYWTARSNVDEAYRSSVLGAPSRQIRVVSWNLEWTIPVARAVEALRPMEADYLLLQRVSRKEAEEIASGLNMRRDGNLQVFYSPANPGVTDQPGNAVMAKHSLYRGRSIRHREYSKDFGIFVESVVDGKRFVLACIDLGADGDASGALADLKREIGELKSPPMTLGGAPAKALSRELFPVIEGKDDSGGGLGISGHWALLGGKPIQVEADSPMITALIEGKP